ncbi:hypothetical protein N657DRAFT_500735 [Parathielavia appendiculata]|uniref:Secreted protein n=1 Tax=Parathielavia appendiculata TaxID=2587402 RepID=A0AAN6TX38_9PEZI|nr:hypothetical protein N657DRAFT_500735 [Parathielavia appendiculata]
MKRMSCGLAGLNVALVNAASMPLSSAAELCRGRASGLFPELLRHGWGSFTRPKSVPLLLSFRLSKPCSYLPT